MQIIPLFLVVCTCLRASWGVRRGKLTPYAHRYTKPHMCKHAHKPRHTWDTPYHTTHKKAHGRGYLCLLTRMCVRTPNTCSSTCSCSHSEAHVPMNTGKPTTMWLQASTCACAGTRVFTTISPHENAHKCLSMCACILFSNSQL